MASASFSFSDKVADSHIISVQHDNSAESSTIHKDHDESKCNHFCHISSHMVGFVSQITTPTIIRDSASYLAFNTQFYSFIHTPPSQPPKA
jgi:hypothetical protein